MLRCGCCCCCGGCEREGGRGGGGGGGGEGEGSKLLAMLVRTIVAGACAAARGVDARLPRIFLSPIVLTSPHDDLDRPLLLLSATLLVTTFLCFFASPGPVP